MTKRSRKAGATRWMDEHWERQIGRFEAAVLSSFTFLESDYGFERRAAERREFADPRDAHVDVPFYGASFALEVQFYIGDGMVAAVIYELEGGRKPERVSFYGDAGYRRAFNVDTFITMVSGGTVPPLLPEINPQMTFAAMYRAGDARTAALESNMEGVVAQLAERVKTWCAPMLKGDTSVFLAVQEFHRLKRNREQ